MFPFPYVDGLSVKKKYENQTILTGVCDCLWHIIPDPFISLLVLIFVLLFIFLYAAKKVVCPKSQFTLTEKEVKNIKEPAKEKDKRSWMQMIQAWVLVSWMMMQCKGLLRSEWTEMKFHCQYLMNFWVGWPQKAHYTYDSGDHFFFGMIFKIYDE